MAPFRAKTHAGNYGDGSQTDGLYTHLGRSGTDVARSGGSRLAAVPRRGVARARALGEYSGRVSRRFDGARPLAGRARQRASAAKTARYAARGFEIGRAH